MAHADEACEEELNVILINNVENVRLGSTRAPAPGLKARCPASSESDGGLTDLAGCWMMTNGMRLTCGSSTPARSRTPARQP